MNHFEMLSLISSTPASEIEKVFKYCEGNVYLVLEVLSKIKLAHAFVPEFTKEIVLAILNEPFPSGKMTGMIKFMIDMQKAIKENTTI